MKDAALIAQPLTGLGFAPFGQVIELPRSGGVRVNQGRGLRFDSIADLTRLEGDAPLKLALYQVTPSKLPFEVALMERHPHSTQIFLPMICQHYVLVVARRLADGAPDIGGASAFIARSDQGIIYHRNVWHNPIVVLGATAQFAMLIHESGEQDDCIEVPLTYPLQVTE